MSVEENIALMKRWFTEVWNEGQLQTVHKLLAENAIGVGQTEPGVEMRGPADFIAFYNRIHGAFPDMKVTLEDAFGADDKVVVRWSAEMTHTGNTLGVPATNKKARITGTTIVRFESGKIVQAWDNWDQLGLRQQLASVAAAS